MCTSVCLYATHDFVFTAVLNSLLTPFPCLYFLPGEGPFPGIIDLFGIIGGLIEFRASLLASHGFAVLALAYFAYEDLPDKLLETDLEYFEEAADFLLAHPKVVKILFHSSHKIIGQKKTQVSGLIGLASGRAQLTF